MRVVAAPDIIEHIGKRFVPGAIDPPADAFDLKRREGALDWNIAPGVARPTSRTDEALVGKQPPDKDLSYFAGCTGDENTLLFWHRYQDSYTLLWNRADSTLSLASCQSCILVAS